MKTKLLSTVTHFVILTKVLIFSRTLYLFQLMGGSSWLSSLLLNWFCIVTVDFSHTFCLLNVSIQNYLWKMDQTIQCINYRKPWRVLLHRNVTSPTCYSLVCSLACVTHFALPVQPHYSFATSLSIRFLLTYSSFYVS